MNRRQVGVPGFGTRLKQANQMQFRNLDRVLNQPVDRNAVHDIVAAVAPKPCDPFAKFDKLIWGGGRAWFDASPDFEKLLDNHLVAAGVQVRQSTAQNGLNDFRAFQAARYKRDELAAIADRKGIAAWKARRDADDAEKDRDAANQKFRCIRECIAHGIKEDFQRNRYAFEAGPVHRPSLDKAVAEAYVDGFCSLIDAHQQALDEFYHTMNAFDPDEAYNLGIEEGSPNWYSGGTAGKLQGYITQSDYKLLGNGYFSGVYSLPGNDQFVIKHGRCGYGDACMDWYEWAMDNQHLHGVPTVVAFRFVPIAETRGYYVAVFESAERDRELDVLEDSYNPSNEKSIGIIKGDSLRRHKWQAEAKAVIEMVYNARRDEFSDYGFDLHTGNILRTFDGRIVVSDPFCGEAYRSKRKYGTRE